MGQSGNYYAVTSSIGVYLRAGGTVLNGNVSSPALTGTITGTRTGISAKGGPTTVANYGAIYGGTNGVILPAGYANPLRIATGSTISGTVNGGNSIGSSARSSLVLGVGTILGAHNIARGTTGSLSGLGGTVTNFSNITFVSGVTWFLNGNVSGIAGGETFSGFTSKDTLDISGIINETISGFAAHTLTLGGGVNIAIGFAGTFTAADFQVTKDPSGGTYIHTTSNVNALGCFAEGTGILTERGEVPVEQLREGDRVVTWLGSGTAPIVWIGRRRVQPARHSKPETMRPVLIRAGAFGPGKPHSALRLSPDHAVFVDGVLIPVGLLVNGRSIVQEDVAEVIYHHIELPEHDVLIAQGLTCESYLNTGDRFAFENGGGVTSLHPSFTPPTAWETKGCGQLIRRGEQLDRVRESLLARALERHAEKPTAKVRAG